MRLLNSLLLFFMFFPFVTPVKLGFDSQPWAFLVALFMIISQKFPGKIVIPVITFGFLISIIYGVFSIFLNIYRFGEVDTFSIFRSLFAVVSLPVCLVAFLIGNHSLERVTHLLKVSIWIYFFVGLVQLIYPSFLTFIIARSSTSDSRGVYSLAPEPVEYARTCIFLFIALSLIRLTDAINKKSFNIYSVLLFIQTLAFSLSGTGFIWVVVIFIIYLFNSGIKKIKLLAWAVFVSVFFYYGIQLGLKLFPEKRLFYLISVAIENPQLLTSFGGFTLRLLNPIHSIFVGVFYFPGTGVGFGFNGIAQTINYAFLGDFFKDVYIDISKRSHGGLVSLFYELGVFAIPFLYAFIGIAYKSRNVKTHGISYSFIFFTFMLVVFFDGPLSNSMLPLLIGIFYLTKKSFDYQSS